MSSKLVADEIRRFLSSTEPEVICISGHWGVGKTSAWRHYLKEAQSRRAIALGRYSYVSLFGINSLDEFRYAIFENSVKSSDVEIEPTLETLKSNTAAVANRLGRRLFGILQQAPFARNYVAGLGPALFLSVRESFICVDDVERKGAGLQIRDVLGLVSTLKEQKRCKIVIILNDEGLEQDQDDFKKYLEKVVDTSLKFAPSSKECVEIALPGKTKAERLLGEQCVSLGISNIRLIKRIERLVRRAEEMLAPFDESVFAQAVQSLALFAWSIYDPSKAPPLEYLKKRELSLFSSSSNETVPEKEAAWNALLDKCRFTGMDEFDSVLLDGIREGFFDPALVEKYANELDQKAKAEKLHGSFLSAWEMFHDSFANNQEEVLDAIYKSASSGIRFVSLVNLSGTISLLKELGRPDKAQNLISQYIASHADEKGYFDLASYPFDGDVKDPDLIRAIQQKYASFGDCRSPSSILESMPAMNGWHPVDITTLSTLSVDEYCQIFVTKTGDDLRKAVNTCLQFDRISNASPEMLEVSRRAREALKRIGGQSPINAQRVKRYGVIIKDSSSQEQ